VKAALTFIGVLIALLVFVSTLGGIGILELAIVVLVALLAAAVVARRTRPA
jgi:hypothetical protein